MNFSLLQVANKNKKAAPLRSQSEKSHTSNTSRRSSTSLTQMSRSKKQRDSGSILGDVMTSMSPQDILATLESLADEDSDYGLMCLQTLKHGGELGSSTKEAKKMKRGRKTPKRSSTFSC